MNRIGLILIGLCLVGGLFVPSQPVSADLGQFSTDPNILYCDFPNNGGEMWVRLTLSNNSGITRTLTVSHWYNYAYQSEGYLPAEESWISEFTPNPVVIPPKQVAMVNIKVSLPYVADGLYQTWLQVRDDPVSEERPITTVIRTGTKVPTFQYSVSPGFYRFSVTGEGDAYRDVEVSIRNEGTGDTSFELFPSTQYYQYEPPSKEVTIDGETKTQWLYENTLKAWVDWKYEPLVMTDYVLKQVNREAALANILQCQDSRKMIPGVAGGIITREALHFTLFVPKGLPSGHYEARVGIRPVDVSTKYQGTGVGIQYECVLFIDVDRDAPGVEIAGGDSWWHGWVGAMWFWGTAGVIGAFVILAVVPRVVRKIRRSKNGRNGRLPNGLKKPGMA